MVEITQKELMDKVHKFWVETVHYRETGVGEKYLNKSIHEIASLISLNNLGDLKVK